MTELPMVLQRVVTMTVSEVEAWEHSIIKAKKVTNFEGSCWYPIRKYVMKLKIIGLTSRIRKSMRNLAKK